MTPLKLNQSEFLTKFLQSKMKNFLNAYKLICYISLLYIYTAEHKILKCDLTKKTEANPIIYFQNNLVRSNKEQSLDTWS